MTNPITSRPHHSESLGVIEDGELKPSAEYNLFFDDLENNLSGSFRGALVYSDSDTTTSSGMETSLGWNMDDYDTDNIHDNSFNNARLTVPNGVLAVKLMGNVEWENDLSGMRQLQIFKNDAPFIGMGIDGKSPTEQGASSAPVMVVPGDYFTLVVLQTSGGDLDILHSSGIETWFSMQILG